MRILRVTVPFAALCLSAGLASAGANEAVVKVYSLDVAQRMQNLELIDVTAEKPADAVPLEEQVQLSLEVSDILAEVEGLEEPLEQ